MVKKKLPDNHIAMYQPPDGGMNIWLAQKRIAELFACSADNISQYLENIHKERELSKSATTEYFSVVQKEGEMMAYQKITDIYATSIDYSVKAATISILETVRYEGYRQGQYSKGWQ